MSGVVTKNAGMLGERVQELMNINHPIVSMARAFVTKSLGSVMLEDPTTDATALEINLAIVEVDTGKYLTSVTHQGTNTKEWDRLYITNAEGKTLFCTDFEPQAEEEISENIIYQLRSDCNVVV